MFVNIDNFQPSMTVPTARQRVLSYLKKHRTVSAAQIGRGLQMAAPAVRYHLSVLCMDGRAVELGAVRKKGRGRPVKLFGPSAQLLGDNLGLLADVVLTERVKKLSVTKRAGLVDALAEGLIDQFSPVDLDGPLGKRLAQVGEKLNEFNYQSRWEAGPDGPRILFAHCPYAAIIEKHPELCAMDAAVLEKLLGKSAQQTAKIGVRSSLICAFQTG